MFSCAVRDACRAAAMQSDSRSDASGTTPSDDSNALIFQFFETDSSLVDVVCSRVRSFLKTRCLTTGLKPREPVPEEKLRCTECDESRLEFIRHDPDMGSTTCISCGCVLAWNQVVSTQWVRTFEGEEDARQHGPVADVRMSLPSHTETKVSKRFERVQNMVYSKSQYVVKQGTTLAYKDKHKKRAFALIDSACGPCSISTRVAEIAKDIFAAYREHKETIHHLNALIAACVIVGNELVEEKVKDSETRVVCSFTCSSCLKEFPSRKGLRFHTCAAQASTSLLQLRPRSLSAYRRRLRSFDAFNSNSPVSINSGFFSPSSASPRDERVSPSKRTRNSRSGPIDVLRPAAIRIESTEKVLFK